MISLSLYTVTKLLTLASGDCCITVKFKLCFPFLESSTFEIRDMCQGVAQGTEPNELLNRAVVLFVMLSARFAGFNLTPLTGGDDIASRRSCL